MIYILYFILLGFILTAIIGLIASWFDRKITARLQYRVGPSFWQPFIDIVKLLGKEVLIPEESSKLIFLLAPLIGLSSVILVSTLFWLNNLNPSQTFLGDLIVAVYLLIVPSLSIILGGFSSKNPFASIGASREIKLILSYELPFILALLVPIIQAGFSIRIGEVLTFQAQSGPIAGTLSGFLALVAIIFCIQAKLALAPFDIAEAETEIISGPLIEYSGVALGIYKLTKHMLLFVLPFFLIILFMGGLKFDGINILYSILKYLGLVTLITIIRNTNPRLRIDQAVRFFWGPMTVLATIAVILALTGR